MKKLKEFKKTFKKKTIMKKFELTEETMVYCGFTLHRIKALRSFGNVQEGTIGGWVESDENLSQSGTCWIGGDAKVFGSTKGGVITAVFGNAIVCNNATVAGGCIIMDKAKIIGDSRVYHGSLIFDSCVIANNAFVYDSTIKGNVVVHGRAKIVSSMLRGNLTIC